MKDGSEISAKIMLQASGQHVEQLRKMLVEQQMLIRDTRLAYNTHMMRLMKLFQALSDSKDLSPGSRQMIVDFINSTPRDLPAGGNIGVSE